MRLRSLLFLLALGSCSEQFPEQLLPPIPPDAGSKVSGLDARPTGTKCKPPSPPAATAKMGYATFAYPALARPVEIVRQGARLYALEQGGVAKVLHEDGQTVTTFADVTARVGATGTGESGLLGIAFHPSFATNGFVYLYYTAPGGPVFDSVLARFESKDGGLTLDLSTEKKILVVAQPYSNHNGATIAFGNDGFLYWGLGDGGAGGDPQNRAQDKTSLLGKMLRIDVDGGDPYAIPPSNPFATPANGERPEIYALGLRNPYRFRFDRTTGDLWAGDVGQSMFEEIDRIVLGGNYGWRIREGASCFNPNPCDATGLVDPVVQHGRTEAISIVGGVVYRGAGVPTLAGQYVYADAGTGQFFAFDPKSTMPVAQRLDEGLERRSPTAFELDANGEVVFVDYVDGLVRRIVAPAPAPEAPAFLSQTGCTDASGTFRYDVVVPQWLDGNEADRFLALGDDGRMRLSPDGTFELPAGSVAGRIVRAGERKIETQLLVVRADGSKGAYAYRWSADGKDAMFAPEASAECRTCHRDERFTLGLETAQLDRDFAFPGGRTGNVLVTLGTLKMIDAIEERATPLVALGSAADARSRARSYLHANCAFCHQDALDVSVPPAKVCEINRGSRIVASMRSTGSDRMPPVGRTTPHDAAILVIEDFLRSTCP
jgi:glucose/arabinose dehydrogenase